MSITNGTKLGPYEILSPLGAGGMGEVYRAKDTTLGREVAIKVLPSDVASSAERLQRFEREAKTVAALNHPNIVTIFGIEKQQLDAGPTHFIAMELVEGETLDRMIAPGGMPLAKIFDIAMPMADALATAHDKGIVHRDLKPANVMVTKEGRVKVLDFGLAKLTTIDPVGASPDDVTMSVPLTGRGVVIGTVPYMSPEQLQGENLDHHTDLFSLGVMLYEMATGHRPFKGKNSATITSSILRDAPRSVHELNSVLPRHLGRIIEHCLEKDPEHRYQSAKDIRNELRALRKEVDSGGGFSESQSVTSPAAVAPPPPSGTGSQSGSGTSLSGSALSAPTRRGEYWIGVGVLAVVIAVSSWWVGRGADSLDRTTAVSSTAQPTTPSPVIAGSVRSVAVIPFESVGGDPSQDYFVDGITGAITDDLAKISALRVTNARTMMRYKGSDSPLPEIARDVSADAFVIGDAVQVGDRVQIRVRLVNATTQEQIWSDHFDRDKGDILKVYNDVARAVAEGVRIELTPSEQERLTDAPTVNWKAYDLYARGNELARRTTKESCFGAIRLFDAAIAIDPKFALAYAAKAFAYRTLASKHLPPSDTMPEMEQAARAALALDDGLVEAHIALGDYLMQWKWDWSGAGKQFARAVELNRGNGAARVARADWLVCMNRPDEALAQLDLAVELDPTAKYTIDSYHSIAFGARKFKRCVREANEALEVDVDYLPAHEWGGLAHSQLGNHDDAIRHLRRAVAITGSPQMRAMLGGVLAVAKHSTEARAIRKELKERNDIEYVCPYEVATISIGLEEYDQAFEEISEACDDRAECVPYLRADPRLDPIRDDPRFDDVLERVGFEPKGSRLRVVDAPSEKSTLGILPFENISNDSDTDYLSHEIPANIIDKLSGLSDLSVISRSGAFRFDSAKEDASSFGKSLGATVVLTGQLNARGDRLTIRAELVDVATNQKLWRHRYNRELTDIMAMEEDITQNISEALRLQLTREERTKLAKNDTENPEAYRAYIEARFWWNRRSEDGFDRAIRLFDRAIALDPQYARAYAGKADCYLMLALYYRPSGKLIPLAKQAIKTALHLDDSMAEAYASFGFLTGMAEHEWGKAEEALQRGISLNPRYATLHHWLGVILFAQSRFDEAAIEMKRANEIDPNSLIVRTSLASFMLHAGDVREAFTHNEATREMDPDFFPAKRVYATMLMASGQPQRAIRVLKKLAASEGRTPSIAGTLGVAYAQAGQISEARDELRTLTQLAKHDYVPALAFASIHASLGNVDEAFRWLDKSYKNRELWIVFLNTINAFDVMHGDPRYDELVRRMGLEPSSVSISTDADQNKKIMLAVLPFANLSGDPDQEYFSDGMTEEMITRLGRLRPELLGVIARTSAMRFKKTDKLIDQIGRELGVAYVIEGGVRRAGNRVRINAQLIQVSDQTQLWGDSYTRDISDVFAVQAEVAEAIAEALAVELLPEQKIAESKAPTESSAAYDAYLLGRSYWAKRTPASLHTAIKHFKHAIELDPNYALAYCGLADSWGVMPYYVPGPYNKINAEGKKAAEKALTLDDSLAEAHVSIARHLKDAGDFATATEHYQKAVAIDPNNATAHQWYGTTLIIQGRHDRGIAEYEKAIALDPLSAVRHNEYGHGAVLARRFDKAIEQLNETLRLQPDFKIAYFSLTWSYIGKEDHNAAATAFESHLRAIDRPAESIKAFRRTYDASGLRAGFLEWLNSLGNDFDSWGAGPARRAPFYAWCDEKDRAFESLDRAIERASPLVNIVATYFPYDNLRDDPRYADLLERIAAKSRTEEVQPHP